VATYLLASTDYDVYFVNPNATDILGRPVHKSLGALPVVPDLGFEQSQTEWGIPDMGPLPLSRGLDQGAARRVWSPRSPRLLWS
jgi:hypothetical protein